MKRALFIDRDGTLVIEPPVDYQLDSLEKLTFYPKVFRNLYFIRKNLDFEWVMVTNQDGLGTAAFPEETFWPAHNKLLQALEGEGIRYVPLYKPQSSSLIPIGADRDSDCMDGYMDSRSRPERRLLRLETRPARRSKAASLGYFFESIHSKLS